MAYTKKRRRLNITEKEDGKFSWRVVERFSDATVDTQTGAQEGLLILGDGDDVADYDTAAAAAKAAFDAAG
tara:strand:- start:268 stop:480 length:213 start_codon:yes stop_codon:yes gene_type:complete